MGIHNFYTYVKRALGWSTPEYQCTNVHYRELTEGAFTSCLLDDDKHEFERSEPYVDVCDEATPNYIVGLFDTLCDQSSGKLWPLNVNAKETKIYGICVDLSSFCYGTIQRIVTDSLEGYGGEGKHDGGIGQLGEGVSTTEKVEDDAGDAMVFAFGNECLSTTFETNKRKVKDAFDESEYNQSDQLPEGKIRFEAPPEVVLDDETLNTCAEECAKKIFNVIGLEIMVYAHYLLLHFDEHTTSCKWYEQSIRRMSCALVIKRNDRRRIFEKTICIVEKRLVEVTKLRLKKMIRCASVQLDPETLDRFVVTALEEKMQLVWANNVKISRHSIGEGEWKCFYGIRDIECELRENGVSNRTCFWYVFGNDSDIGLGVLLYSSERTRIHYVMNTSKRIVSFPERFQWDNITTYKALHFFALSLLGNDYIPRVVNESPKNIESLSGEVNRMLAADDKQCRNFLQALADVFRDRMDPSRKDETSETNEERIGIPRAIAYVITRLLLAVYDSERISVPSLPTEYESSGSQQSEVSDRTLLRCNDDIRRSFTECFAVFARRLLWYLVYCIFYRNMDKGQRQTFRNEALTDGGDFSLDVNGLLSSESRFTYNDSKLRQAAQFGFKNLFDVRSVVKGLSTLHLMRILEHVLSNELGK